MGESSLQYPDPVQYPLFTRKQSKANEISILIISVLAEYNITLFYFVLSKSALYVLCERDLFYIFAKIVK